MFKIILDFVKKYLLPLVIIVLVIFVLLLMNHISVLNKEIASLYQKSLPETIKPQESGAGNVGEIMVEDEETGEQAPLVSPIMPPEIFSTTGIIIEVKTDRVIIKGKGTNFADGKARVLTVVFTNETITFDKTSTFRQTGAIGLKQLESAMEVLIGSSENIRGKTEFKAKTLKIL
ncbi:hypothetical protein KAS79_01365 [Candidatus Parcubacteria bacterium]|nr:hypothetical protein [Candidatus Parcubacteria bacterium]